MKKINNNPIQGTLIWKSPKPYNFSPTIPDPDKIRLEFPHLVRFKGAWYCAFREADIHYDHPSGKVRIIRSVDGVNWKSVVVLAWEGGDVGARLAVTSEGILMASGQVIFVSKTPRAKDDYHQLDGLGLFGGIRQDDRETEVTCQAVTWLSTDGIHWGSAYACPSGVNTRRYDVTWHNGMGYSYAQIGKDIRGTLYRTRDGKSWRVLKSDLMPQVQSDEASLAFGENGTAYCLYRGDSRSVAMLGVGQAPYYQTWEWKPLLVDWHGDGSMQPVQKVLRCPLAGPLLMRLADGRLLAAGRARPPERPNGVWRADPSEPEGIEDGRVLLFWLDPQKTLLTRFAEIDGTSYPGIVEHEGRIWVTYIVYWGDRPGIYLAKIPIK